MTTACQRQNVVGLVFYFQVRHLCRYLFRLHQGVTRIAFCACKRPGPKLKVVPASTRFQVFLKCEIIIPAASRCCPNHVDDGYFKADVWSQIKTSKNSLLNRSSIFDLVKRLRVMALQNSSELILNHRPTSRTVTIET